MKSIQLVSSLWQNGKRNSFLYYIYIYIDKSICLYFSFYSFLAMIYIQSISFSSEGKKWRKKSRLVWQSMVIPETIVPKKKKKKMRNRERNKPTIVIERVNLAKYFASVRERFFCQCFFQNMHMYTFRFQYIKWEIYYTCTSDRVFGYSVTLALYQELYCKRRALFYSPILNMCTMTPFEKANL